MVRYEQEFDKVCRGYEWVMYNKDASKFINDIEPYKINQIKIAIERQEKGITRRFKCHYCELDYANPSARRRHEKSIHLETQTLVG